MKKTVKVQSVTERLVEIDTVILNTSQRGCDLIRSGAPVSEIDTVTDFLHSLYRRREVILSELKKAGITEKQAYESIRNPEGKERPRYELDRYMVQKTVRTEQ